MSSKLFSLEKTSKTPHILFDPVTGDFEMKGTSIPENSIGFYNPLFDWLNEYILNPAPKTKVQIQMEYFNTSSSKCIYTLLMLLDKIKKDNTGEVEVNWLYLEDDEDMMDAGEYLKFNVTMPFNFISID